MLPGSRGSGGAQAGLPRPPRRTEAHVCSRECRMGSYIYAAQRVPASNERNKYSTPFYTCSRGLIQNPCAHPASKQKKKQRTTQRTCAVFSKRPAVPTASTLPSAASPRAPLTEASAAATSHCAITSTACPSSRLRGRRRWCGVVYQRIYGKLYRRPELVPAVAVTAGVVQCSTS